MANVPPPAPDEARKGATRVDIDGILRQASTRVDVDQPLKSGKKSIHPLSRE